MNYRHSYHAGNAADVMKHVVFCRLIDYLKRKDKPFRVLDTHAGIGLYNISGVQATKTGEWQQGIKRLMETPAPPDIALLLAPYVECIRTLNPEGGLRLYPGSPMLAKLLLRPRDRLSAIELHPEDAGTLRQLFGGDAQVRVTCLDGWLALGAHVPFKERRGLVLVDPPFEQEGEYLRMAAGLEQAVRRFATGTFCLWYPLTAEAPLAAFYHALGMSRLPDILLLELSFKSADAPGLTGSGLVIVNPPFTLEAELQSLLPFLCRVLAQGHTATWRMWRPAS